MSRVWKDSAELLELFDIDITKSGARDFAALCDLWGLLLHFWPEFNGAVIVRAMLRDSRVSPLVFWSNIRRSCAPLLRADRGTLAALGLQLESCDTAMEYARSVAMATAPDWKESARADAEALRERLYRSAEKKPG